MVHSNSISSFEEITPKLSGRRKDVYNVIHQSGKKMTDREVKETLGVSDMNYVRPRITELLKLGHIVEVDDVKCSLTNKTVRRVATIDNVNNALECFAMQNNGGQNHG